MKKICYVSTTLRTLFAFVVKTAEYLNSTGEFEISFISSPDKELEKNIPDYIHFYPVKMHRGIAFDGLLVISKIKKILKKEQFDLVQYSTPNASLYTSIAAKLAKIPVRLYCQWGIVYVGFAGFKRYIFKFIEKTICRFSTWIEPDSKGNLDFSHQEGLYPENMGSVIWNGSACGISLDKFDISKKEMYRTEIRTKFNISKNDFVFGFVGRVTRDKGINELIEAYKHIYENNKNTFLMIVGRSEMTKDVNVELYQWAVDCPNVIFTGRVPNPEAYLSGMDCYILPSYREGFGMTVIEAEAMGVPVIVTNIPGPIDGMIKNKTGLIVEKKESEGLKEAMNYMISNPNVVSEFGKAAHEYAVTNFEQKQLFDRILEDRRSLLNISNNV